MSKLRNPLLLFTNLLPVILCALEIHPGDWLTSYGRFDPETYAVTDLTVYDPSAFIVDGEDLIVRSNSISFTPKLWRYDPETGRQTELANSDSLGATHAAGVMAGIWEEELFLMTSGNSVSSIQVTAVNLVTGEERHMDVPDHAIGYADLVLTNDGKLVTNSVDGGAIILNRSGEILANPAPPLSLRLKALTRMPDGRIVGVTPTAINAGLLNLDLVEVNPDTGELSVFQTLPGLDKSTSFIRLAPNADGDLYMVVVKTRDDFSFYRIDGETFGVTEIPFPEGVLIDTNTCLKVEADGSPVLVVEDERIGPASGLRILLRLDPEFFEAEIALGHVGSPSLPGPAIDFRSPGTMYFSTNKLLKVDLKTGGVAVVSDYEEVSELIHSIVCLAADGDTLYLIDKDAERNIHLLQADAISGAVTHLSQLGTALLPQHMEFDASTGELFITTWAGHPAGGLGTILRVRPEAGALPEAVTATPFASSSGGFTIAPNGDFYVGAFSASSRQIYHVDRGTGVISTVADSLDFQFINDLGVLDDGNLLVLDTNRLVEVNVADASIKELVGGFILGSGSLFRAPSSDLPVTFASASQATPFDNGWYESGWYGWFNQTTPPWILHLEHGWQYFGGGQPDSYFLYDSILHAWIWVSPDTYPLLYAFDPYNDWLIYSVGGVPGLRWFFSYNGNEWINTDNLPPSP